MDKSLPFRRGQSFKTDLDAAQTGDPGVIYGRIFEADDSHPGDGSSHGTKQTVILRALQALAALNVSSSLSGARARRNHKLLEASTLNTRSLNQQVSRLATGGAGTFAHVLDDMYSATAPTFIANDILYSVEFGICRGTLSCIQAQIAPAGGEQPPLTPLSRSADGRLRRAQSGDVVLAVAMQTFRSTRTGESIVIQVGACGGSGRFARN